MLHDCLIIQSLVSYHSTVMGSEARLLCPVFVYHSAPFFHNASRLEVKKQAPAARALIQSVSSPTDPNPLTPQPNV